MDTKFFRIVIAVTVLSVLQSCPEIKEECNDTGNVTRINDLVKITPLKKIYTLGDIITYTAYLPALVNFDGNLVNIYNKTLDSNARLHANPIFFLGNQTTYIKGSQEDANGWTNVTYNSSNQMYELEVKIKLNKLGTYSIISGEYFEVIGKDICNRYRIDSKIEGTDANGKIEFTVQ
ncbi:hypothetical protein ASG01_09090 [Chryseobacterium sp. Leaf180]|uniref:hypothetical protein n=1 Tax=Chryseobacterium sp. Leaf180 TaxID=1736289 RepID=UPI0006F4ADF9|nr:hypothetical protein [Chryseobacterium sp. Leaf180]KQR93340.1 hypothetical protein ASG01_09090 [Chryseobacterium sp. Leaf180]